MNQTLKKIEEVEFEKLPKYKNGSKAIPKDEIVVPYTAVKSFLTQSNLRVIEKVVERVLESIDRMSVGSSVEFKAGYEEAKKDAKDFIKYDIDKLSSTLIEQK